MHPSRFLLPPLFALLLRGGAALFAAEPVPPSASREVPDLATRKGEDWGSFLGPTGNGRSGVERLTLPWPKGGPRVAWHCEMGEGYCGPAVALGRAVVFDRIGQDIRLRCLRAETGEKIWEERYPTGYADMFGYDGGPRAAPVIAGDRVLTFGPEGRLECRSPPPPCITWCRIFSASARRRSWSMPRAGRWWSSRWAAASPDRHRRRRSGSTS
jgi:hypothetical protein